MSSDVLTVLERSDEDCIMRFADGASFRLNYLTIRSNCQCANCKPRQVNEQRRIEFEEEIMRLRKEEEDGERAKVKGLLRNVEDKEEREGR